ncbi:MAG: TonB-dependent receptor [Woeseiaceae bacterium]|nr:TonB-dependent receptor [Woeseiaceae bacterium]
MKLTKTPRLGAAFILVATSFAIAGPAFGDGHEAIDVPVDEIVVTADLRGRTADDVPAALTLIDGDLVDELATQHFEELVRVVPNFNWSGDGHRARYFQIRGVGELEQYQGAPNPSVGFLIDDIDFSGIGTIATLFDIGRVEVLRGPQGSRYGANALGGLVYVQSTLPSAEPERRVSFSVGDDDMLSAGLAVGGALDGEGRVLFRVSAHHHESNGFRDNTFLGRDDTNGRDETTVRGRLLFNVTDDLTINIAALISSIDNGYDAFALDSGFIMLSDNPGRDAQDSVGTSLRADWTLQTGLTLTSITAFADSDIDFGFDADWGNADSWAPFTYDYVSSSDRERRTLSQEFRLAAPDGGRTDWVVGLYALQLEDDLLTVDTGEYFDPFFNFADSLDARFGSGFESTSVALFGQVEQRIGERTWLSAGLRAERRSTEYEDTAGLSIGPGDAMLGGEITLSHDHTGAVTSFVTLSRGYKAGGFNLGVVPDEVREFDDETLLSLEAGVKASLYGGRLAVNASVFANERRDQQVRTSFQLDPNNPASFGFATINAETSEALGLEAELNWIVSETIDVYASLGLLDTRFDEFTTAPELIGRAQAHAPEYTFAAGGSYRHPSGWFLRVDASAKDEFYFDVSHDQRSDSYELVNARLGYDADAWKATLWIRNAFDEQYAVRGFFFGNEPPNFEPTLYTRPGDARQVGITFDMEF